MRKPTLGEEQTQLGSPLLYNFGEPVKYPVFPPGTGVDPMAFLDLAFEEMELSTAEFLIFLSTPLDTCQRAHHTGKLLGWEGKAL